MQDIDLLKSRMQSMGRGPQRPMIYFFAHQTLRTEAFENHPEFIADLAGERGEEQFWHAMANAELLCRQNNFIPENQGCLSSASTNPFAAERELLQGIVLRACKREGFTVFILEMPEPRFAPEAHLIAVVHRNDEPHSYRIPSPSTRYFTVEKGSVAPDWFFCEWSQSGRHDNFGKHAMPDAESFTDWVFAKLSA